MKMFDMLSKKYGIIIADDGVAWRGDNMIKQYAVYSADGCKWSNGLSYKSLLKMCKADADALLAIKNACRK